MQFRVGVALITPFDEEGKIDFFSLGKLIDRQIELGTEALICAGSTGEGSSLGDREWEELIGFVCAHVDGAIQVIANSGTCNTFSSVERTEIAKASGADACMAITPYYCKPTLRGCKAHFEAICAVGLPVYLYYNPPRTGVKWLPSELAEVASLPGIIGVKDASGDLSFSEQWKALCPKPLYVGNDDQLLSLMKKGAHGIISIIGNLLPREVEEIVKLSAEGNFEKAEELFAPLASFFPILYQESNPQGIKAAMSLAGLSPPYLRLPLVEVEKENLEEIQDHLELSLASLSSLSS